MERINRVTHSPTIGMCESMNMECHSGLEEKMRKLLIVLALIWTSKQFGTIDDLVRFLNTLSDDRAKEAKILVINSQRSFLGVLSSPYFLIYREDRQ